MGNFSQLLVNFYHTYERGLVIIDKHGMWDIILVYFVPTKTIEMIEIILEYYAYFFLFFFKLFLHLPFFVFQKMSKRELQIAVNAVCCSNYYDIWYRPSTIQTPRTTWSEAVNWTSVDSRRPGHLLAFDACLSWHLLDVGAGLQALFPRSPYTYRWISRTTVYGSSHKKSTSWVQVSRCLISIIIQGIITIILNNLNKYV